MATNKKHKARKTCLSHLYFQSRPTIFHKGNSACYKVNE